MAAINTDEPAKYHMAPDGSACHHLPSRLALPLWKMNLNLINFQIIYKTYREKILQGRYGDVITKSRPQPALGMDSSESWFKPAVLKNVREFEKLALLTGYVKFLSCRCDNGITPIFQEFLTTHTRTNIVQTPWKPSIGELASQSSRITINEVDRVTVVQR